MNPMSTTLSALVLATAAHAAAAQGTNAPTAPMTATSQPQAVGVSPQASSASLRKAIPRSDTATVVRTGPSAADKAASASRETGTDGQLAAGSARRAASGATTPGVLPPRADRH